MTSTRDCVPRVRTAPGWAATGHRAVRRREEDGKRPTGRRRKGCAQGRCLPSPGMADLLVVEDDETIGAALTSGLRAHGHAVSWQRSGRKGLDAAAGRAFDMALLDLGLPDLDGVEVCRRLRASSPGTVLVVLTARADEMDVVVGLEAGADDYLTKPFRFGELLARIRAHLRRQAVVPPSQEHLVVGRLRLDAAARRVTVDDVEVALRTKEFELLARLAADA